MSEIKEGDRIALYANFHCVLRRAICIVTKVDKLGFLVKFCNTDKDGFVILPHEITNRVGLSFPDKNYENFWFHRKQCRRLVKVKTCPTCKGCKEIDGGAQNFNYFSLEMEFYPTKYMCIRCNGKGKVRV